ncbi:MAG: peptide ABC transporter substrate-binding protein [Pseudomonadota bacterium]
MIRWTFTALALLVVCGCGGQTADQATGASVDVLRRAIPAPPQSLDPHRAEGTGSGAILRDLYEGLIGEAPGGELVPGAAESWTISDDGLTYTFLLREGLLWSNGDPLVAEHFASGLRRTIDPETASAYAPLLRPIQNATAVIAGEQDVADLGIRALDARTLEIRLEQPTPFFLGLLTSWVTFPLHQASFDAYGPRFVRPEHSVTNGPYTLASQRVGDRITLKKNPNYRDAANVDIDQVEFLAIEDTATELRLFEAGELDITSSTPNGQFQSLKARYGDQLHVTTNLSVYFMVFDLTEPPFSDVRLREALSIALDRKALTESVLGAGQTGAFGVVPPGIANYDSFSFDWRELPRDEQLALARQLYRDAGFTDDSPLQATLIYNTGDSHQKVAVALQAMVREALGARLEVTNQEFRVMLSNRNKRELWDIMRLGWTGDYNDPNTYLEIFRSEHPQNFASYSNPEYDALLDEAARTLDTSTRRELLYEAESTLMRDYPILPMYFYVSRHLVSERVVGFAATPMDRTYSAHLEISDSAATR